MKLQPNAIQFMPIWIQWIYLNGIEFANTLAWSTNSNITTSIYSYVCFSFGLAINYSWNLCALSYRHLDGLCNPNNPSEKKNRTNTRTPNGQIVRNEWKHGNSNYIPIVGTIVELFAHNSIYWFWLSNLFAFHDLFLGLHIFCVWLQLTEITHSRRTGLLNVLNIFVQLKWLVDCPARNFSEIIGKTLITTLCMYKFLWSFNQQQIDFIECNFIY